MKGGEQTLTVALRIRPMNEDETLQGASHIAYKVEENMVVLMDPTEDPDNILRANRSRERQFIFDFIFDGSITQEDVYQATTKSLIENVISGYNATVFAYGATGAGKTYTMLGTDEEPGIMCRALNELFLEMDRTRENMVYKVTMSYLEIYNEMIRDLLNPSVGILDLREDAKGGVQVAGLSEVFARSTDEVVLMLMKGNKERTHEPTAANQASSRSHAILQVTVKQRDRMRDSMQEVRVGKLFLIDLAGSERAANTLNRGKRMVEGAHINRSLLALGNCINALTDKNGGQKYVNYRDSKLTRLLKDSLGGNCKTIMIAHISPASMSFEESRNTLIYADRAKHIKTKVRRNITDVSYHIAQYTNIISELREEISQLKIKLSNQVLQNKQQGIANIQAVQSEVLKSKGVEDREELTKLKDQLLTSFKDQMELRKTIMDLNNSSMEISLETNRNQFLITQWEAEQVRNRKKNLLGLIDNRERDSEKCSEMSGDEAAEPERVKVARKELTVLHGEKHKMEALRSSILKEIHLNKQRTEKLKEILPMKVSNDDHREILRLMLRVHQLEIENTEYQSVCLLNDFQIRKRDMIIKNHHGLCDEIIKQQRALIYENKISCPKDLEDMYSLYQLEEQDKSLEIDESFIAATDKCFESTIKKRPSESEHPNFSIESNGKGSPISSKETEKEWLGSEKNVSQKNFRNNQPENNRFTFSRNKVLPLVEGNSHNDVHLSSSKENVHEDPTVILTKTRGIAARAAEKKSKHNNENSDRMLPYRPLTDTPSESSYLSPSRLAKHDNNFGDLSMVPSDDSLSTMTFDKTSLNTEATLLQVRRQQLTEDVHRDMQRRKALHDTDHRRHRIKSYDSPVYKQPKNPRRPGNNGVKLGPRNLKDRSKGDPLLHDNDSSVVIPSHLQQQYGRERRKSIMAQRHRGPLNNHSTASPPVVSTPQKSQHPMGRGGASISHYRRGDISVNGFGIPR